MSAAVILFDFSLLYGLSSATNLSQIAAACQGLKLDPLFAVAIVMMVAGFRFKVATVPFHLWASDVYEGAPMLSAAFIASGSKLAGFYIFARVRMLGFAVAEGSAAWHGFLPGWAPVVALAAGTTMVLGNLTALVQTSVRRLLAYAGLSLMSATCYSESCHVAAKGWCRCWIMLSPIDSLHSALSESCPSPRSARVATAS
jgi:NADH-quinone oxidoreductase subunit N